jgi:hypothetical protein
MRPSDLLDIPPHPSLSSLRFSVDETIVDFMLWVEGKANEKVIGKAPERQPKKGEQWVSRYQSVADILAEYGRDDTPETLPVDMTEVAALVAAMTDATDPEF